MASPTATLRDRFEQRFKHWRYDPPYKTACAGMAILLVAVLALTWMQFRGAFEEKTQLTVLANRSGLSMDPGSKVTFNGVPIGRLTAVNVADVDGEQQAELTLDVKPKYLKLIPENVTAELKATTVFGNKYTSTPFPRVSSTPRCCAPPNLAANWAIFATPSRRPRCAEWVSRRTSRPHVRSSFPNRPATSPARSSA